MGIIGRALRWVFAASIFAVATPILLLALIVYLGGAILAGLIATVMLAAILGTVLGPIPNPVQWIVAFPVVLSCMVVGGWMWSERFGLRQMFGRSAGDSHGSARLASTREIAALAKGGDMGLLIGRDPKTGKILGYGGPAHLLTLAPTRAGKGMGMLVKRAGFAGGVSV